MEINKWTSKLWCTHTREYYTAMKMNQLLLTHHTGETHNVEQIKLDTGRMNKHLLNKCFR